MTARDVILLLSRRERRRWALLLALMCASSVIDVFGVASILPFLAVLASPEVIRSHPLVREAYVLSGFATPDQFLLALGIASFLAIAISTAVRAATLYAQSAVVGETRHSLSCALLEGYLAQPYSFFLDRHSGEMGRNILSEADQFVDRALSPLASAASSGFVAAAMTGVLILADPVSAALAAGVLAAIYSIMFMLVRPVLTRMGQQRLESNRVRFESVSEALGGIKTVKLLGREESYTSRFRATSQVFARNIAKTAILGQLPRFAVETLAFGGILMLALVLMIRNGGAEAGALKATLPMLGLYALAGYRILPAVQTLYQSLTQLRFAGPAIAAIRRELALISANPPATAAPRAPLPFRDSLTISGLSFRYPNAAADSLSGISLTIQRGTRLGIVGATGSGKTTLVDLILGLLEPTEGEILVDGVPLDAQNRSAWQMNLGYVPQDIFLTDSSVAANIAFGLKDEEIDMDRVVRCAELARIHDFVTSQLPKGYATRVGERGVRLSGGQRQRIGIARALYRDPEVLVLDEATSALDYQTEAEVMEAINGLPGGKTVIIIAHRLTTVEGCSRIQVLQGGISRAVVPDGPQDATLLSWSTDKLSRERWT